MLTLRSLDPLRPRRGQRGPVLAGLALHLAVLDGEVHLRGAGIAVHHLEFRAQQVVAQHRQDVAVGAGRARAEHDFLRHRICKRLHRGRVPGDCHEDGLRDAADPTELRCIEERVLAVGRQGLEQLLERQTVLHCCELGAVVGGAIVEVVGQSEPARSWHVLRYQRRASRNMATHVAGECTRIKIVSAAGSCSDEQRNLPAREKIGDRIAACVTRSAECDHGRKGRDIRHAGRQLRRQLHC